MMEEMEKGINLGGNGPMGLCPLERTQTVLLPANIYKTYWQSSCLMPL